MSEPLKHHYLPIFYLSQWANAEGKLCEYARPHMIVTTKWKAPAATGYQTRLYTLPGLPPDKAQRIEKFWMGRVDDDAAKALQPLLAKVDDLAHELTPKQRVAWARFLYSLTFRNPEYVLEINRRYAEHAPGAAEAIRREYQACRSASDPETFEEFRAKFLANPLNTSGLNVLPRLLTSSKVIGEIALMNWSTIKLRHFAGRRFLTSDRPVIMTNGLARPDAHVVLPLSPDILFVAYRGPQAYDLLARLDGPELVRVVNEKVTVQAHRFVYGTDASQLTFVAKRLGKKVVSTPLG